MTVQLNRLIVNDLREIGNDACDDFYLLFSDRLLLFVVFDLFLFFFLSLTVMSVERTEDKGVKV